MSANPEPRHESRESYYYRRRLSGAELLPALAIGVGAGLLAFYVARMFMQRTPLLAGDASSRERKVRPFGGDEG